MFAKLSTALALFALAAQVVVAAPPACLLAAVNTQSDPSDIESVCDGGAQEVMRHMSNNCGDNLRAATSAFTAVCEDAGVTVAASSTSSTSSSPSSTKSSQASSTSDDDNDKSATMTEGTTSASASASASPYVPVGTGGSTGFATRTSANNGTYPAPTGGFNPPTPTESGMPLSTGGAGRVGMDLLGLAAVGIFGAMVTL